MVDYEEELDYQLGASDVDQSGVSNGELIPFQMESRVVFRRLAEDIYPSPKVGIREALTNAITATNKVENDDFEPIINIYVDGTDSDRSKLIIEDNGIGMTMKTIREVVTYIGRSTVRDDYQKAGQFGMGFLALFSLCGTSGGFIMHSNSRTPYGEPISGVWKDGGFTRFDDTTQSVKDMNGTRFEIILRDGISVEDIRTWVEDIAKWSRVPILYEDRTKDDVYSNEFGVSTLDSLIKDDEISIKVDNEYYTAVCSPVLKETPTILLDVLIERNNNNKIPYIPFSNLAIRLKSEHPVVMDGEYEGKMVVRDIEYEQLPDNRKNKYVPKRKVSSDIPITPAPTGTREKLKENPKFWAEVGLNLKEKHNQKLKSIIESIDREPLSNITPIDWKFVEDSLFTNLDNYKRFNSYIKSKYPSSYSEEFAEKIYGLLQSVRTYEYSPVINSTKSLNPNKSRLYSILQEEYDYVFMFISKVNHEKAMRIHASENSYVFIKIPNADWYEFYENTLGWHKVKDVDESHPVCEEVSVEDIKNVKSSNNKKEQDDEDYVNIHLNYNASYKKIYLKNIPEKIDTKNDEYIMNIKDCTIEKLIVFPQSSKYNIKDYKWMKSDTQALVRAKNSEILTELTNIPVSITIDDLIESANDIMLSTSEGVQSCCDISFTESIIHIVPKSIYNIVSSKNDSKKMLTLFSENKFNSIKSPNKEMYIPVLESTFYDILPLIKQSTVINTGNYDIPIDEYINGPSNSQCKLYMSQFDNRDVDIIQEIDANICSGKPLTGSRISIISLLEAVSDANIDLSEVSINA